ncbi:hypothetical protein [Haloarcula onubensis]|uniref:Nickel/cobalt efflux system n=1 Tax=Haloarcula onubensis TaxID=2950539 RepID=A0ABU2FJB5_9EURY|nr:hypothetical protein [Halomicroarcula sp. S3CR25-11]MDS0280850.1 hypothetical protein [Halomicroarcula sp. S3CR25-11]
MTATVAAAVTTAGLLGVTHAVEPDHVAGIASLTGEYGDSRLSALAGACFSLGHIALVVAWLAVAWVLLGRTSFPAVVDAAGTVGVGLVLGLLGAAMALGGLRSVVRTDAHDHGDRRHSHPYVRLTGFDATDHGHDAASYLRTGLVGALFTLSPPVSMMVFAATLFPDYGGGVVALAVLTYAVAITATMSAVGAGAGAAFGATRGWDSRAHAVAKLVAGVAVTALAGSLLLDGVTVLA